MKRSTMPASVASVIARDPQIAPDNYEQEIRNLRALAASSDLSLAVRRFLDHLAPDPRFHSALRPETAPVLRSVATAALSRLTGGQKVLEFELLRCAGTGLVHGICVAGGYVVLALFFPDDNLGLLSAMVCPPGIVPWHARVQFQPLQAPGAWPVVPPACSLN